MSILVFVYDYQILWDYGTIRERVKVILISTMGPTMGMKFTDTKILKPCQIWSEKGDLINKKARGKNSWRDRIWDFQTYSHVTEQRLEVEIYIPSMIHQQFWPNWQPMSKVGSKESGKMWGNDLIVQQLVRKPEQTWPSQASQILERPSLVWATDVWLIHPGVSSFTQVVNPWRWDFEILQVPSGNLT